MPATVIPECVKVVVVMAAAVEEEAAAAVAVVVVAICDAVITARSVTNVIRLGTLHARAPRSLSGVIAATGSATFLKTAPKRTIQRVINATSWVIGHATAPNR